MVEAVIDRKGRVVIPRRLREKLGLHEGAEVRLMVEGGRIALVKPVSAGEFIRDMEGFVREASPLPKRDPMLLKEIWESRE